MLITIVFYFTVCLVFCFMATRKPNDRVLSKKYTRNEMLFYSYQSSPPADWVSVDSIKKKIKKSQVRLKPKLLNDCNKENENPFKEAKPAQSLTSFILKELEVSMHQLTKQQGKLNPYAEEFRSLTKVNT